MSNHPVPTPSCFFPSETRLRLLPAPSPNQTTPRSSLSIKVATRLLMISKYDTIAKRATSFLQLSTSLQACVPPTVVNSSSFGSNLIEWGEVLWWTRTVFSDDYCPCSSLWFDNLTISTSFSGFLFHRDVIDFLFWFQIVDDNDLSLLCFDNIDFDSPDVTDLHFSYIRRFWLIFL